MVVKLPKEDDCFHPHHQGFEKRGSKYEGGGGILNQGNSQNIREYLNDGRTGRSGSISVQVSSRFWFPFSLFIKCDSLFL